MDAGPIADRARRWPGQVTERTLADGRPILYFDDEATAGPVHTTADARPLLEAPRAGEVRYDVLTGEWVTIAGHRMNRTFLPSAADCPLDPTRDPARPILYFDDEATAGPVHTTADARPLLEAPRAGEVRYDVLTGEWVTIAGHRMNRTFLPSAADCPLDPTRDPARPTEVPDSAYDVAVFANRFPSFAPLTAGPVEGTPAVPFGPPDAPAHGHCDVVVFSSDHDAAVVDLPAARMRTIVEAWAQRTAVHSADPGVAEVFVFENSGQEIGVTLTHPHGQVYAYPVVAPRTGQLLEQARRHRDATGGNLLADVLAAEQAEGTRVVLAGEHFTAYVPRAARWPVEVHLAPHRDVPDLAALDDAERAELAGLYQELLRRVNRFHPGVEQVPYISGWHQAPTGEQRDLGRLHLQLFSLLRAPGKLKYLAGSESGMGAWINDTTPERIAERLREVAS